VVPSSTGSAPLSAGEATSAGLGKPQDINTMDRQIDLIATSVLNSDFER
jgi:hypothetical protein